MQSKLNNIAHLIDEASDNDDVDTINRALALIEKLKGKELSSHHLAQLYFFAANCHASIRAILGENNSWAWENGNLEKEIYYLRLSLLECNVTSFEDDLSDLRFRVRTNLANALNHIGRFIEAVEIWDSVLELHHQYSMAIGNRGYCLSWYARYLYDTGHQPIFLNKSYREIKKALELGVEEHATRGMLEWLKHLGTLGNWDEFQIEPKDESRGRSKLERTYRTWCINNRLFLNPLNDIWKKDIVANDVLTFPSIVLPIAQSSPSPPEVYGIYNQLKQEYVSARYVLFDAIEESGRSIHFSDKRVKLYDMLDYRHYRLWIEKLKMAFLSTYAIFDKIAYLINEYWKLEIPVQEIKFNTVWFKAAKQKKALLDIFNVSDNWPLKGLFWLSKDLYFKQSVSQPIEPDARHLNHIRNHIAHKYLKVYDNILVDTEAWRNNYGHELSYPISDMELKNQSLKLMKLVRSALIYISLAVHAAESKAKEKLSDGLIAEMHLYEVDDSYRP
jgi:hypothetical protein